MPCILKIHVEAARGLPVIDRTSELVDAYVEIRFGDQEVQRTSVCRKTLNPIWKEDFRFEVFDETILQDEPIELKVFDFDAITTDDSVGTVTIDLNPLLSPDAPNQLAGWFPIYDTIWGNRGELWLQVKLEFFENTNPFKDSSAGVHLFSCNGIPNPYKNASIVGLVDVVITEIDPDYHWSDNFRTSRSSNEASQRILNQMSCRLRRQMGRKALEMGGNSILGYTQMIDIEPYAQTITFRGLGTVVIMNLNFIDSVEKKDINQSEEEFIDLASKGIELATISKLPNDSILANGGIVSAKSVKLMSEESDYKSAITRDRWLCELRDEIKIHARNLGCNIVLGYKENISVQDDLYIVAVEGTACRVKRQYKRKQNVKMIEDASSADEGLSRLSSRSATQNLPKKKQKIKRFRDCSSCHLSKHRMQLPQFENINDFRCNICKRSMVPEILLCTIDLPSSLETLGELQLVESYVCRPLKKKKENEISAISVSSNLAFVEYNLYRQLQFKLRYHCLNGIFGLRYQIVANANAIIAIASGTGAFIAGLPRPKPLQICRNIEIKDAEDEEIFQFQENVAKSSTEKHSGMERLFFSRFPNNSSSSSTDDSSSSSSSSDSSDSEIINEECEESIVQIDDEADEDLLLTLIEPDYDGKVTLAGTIDFPIEITNDSSKPKVQFICQFRRFALELDDHHPNSLISNHFVLQYEDIFAQINGLFDKRPIIQSIRHQINLVRNVELQIVTTATVIGFSSDPFNNFVDHVDANELLLHAEPFPSDDDDDEDELNSFEKMRSPNLRRDIRQGQELTGQKSINQLVTFCTSPDIPHRSFKSNCGTITIQLFKEIHFHECRGGFSAFVYSTINDVFSIARASSASLGGNGLVSLSFRPAAFYENFKNQLHAVVHLTGDIVNVEEEFIDSNPTQLIS